MSNAAKTNPTLHLATKTKIGQATTSKSLRATNNLTVEGKHGPFESSGPPQKRITKSTANADISIMQMRRII
jgi:hypothetical protein